MEKEQIKKEAYIIAAKLYHEEVDLKDEIINFVERFRMTSIDVLEYLLAIETEFDFEFEDDYLNESILKDSQVLYDYIFKRTNG